MTYRPITDTWMLARAKLKDGKKYYGSYPAGFLQRARDLLGVSIDDAVLHVCGGLARFYPYAGFGPNDRTMDLDPATDPDFLQDARESWAPYATNPAHCHPENYGDIQSFKAYLMDPPYSEADATHYLGGDASKYPSPNLLLKRAFEVMKPGQKVGCLHYILPKPPGEAGKDWREVAVVQVIVGNNNRGRVYSVFEKLK